MCEREGETERRKNNGGMSLRVMVALIRVSPRIVSRRDPIWWSTNLNGICMIMQIVAAVEISIQLQFPDNDSRLLTATLIT